MRPVDDLDPTIEDLSKAVGCKLEGHVLTHRLPTIDLSYRMRCSCGRARSVSLAALAITPQPGTLWLTEKAFLKLWESLPPWHKPEEVSDEDVQKSGVKKIESFEGWLSPQARKLFDRRFKSTVLELTTIDVDKLLRDRNGTAYAFHVPLGGMQAREEMIPFTRVVTLCRFFSKVAPCISESDRRPDPKCVAAFAEAINRLASARLLDYGTLMDGAYYLPLLRDEETGDYRCAIILFAFGDSYGGRADTYNDEVNAYLGTKLAVMECNIGDGDWNPLMVQPQDLEAEIEAQVAGMVIRFKVPEKVLLGKKQREQAKKIWRGVTRPGEEPPPGWIQTIMTQAGSVEIVWTEDEDRCQVVPIVPGLKEPDPKYKDSPFARETEIPVRGIVPDAPKLMLRGDGSVGFGQQPPLIAYKTDLRPGKPTTLKEITAAGEDDGSTDLGGEGRSDPGDE